MIQEVLLKSMQPSVKKSLPRLSEYTSSENSSLNGYIFSSVPTGDLIILNLLFELCNERLNSLAARISYYFDVKVCESLFYRFL
jgi:hypothetical protein